MQKTAGRVKREQSENEGLTHDHEYKDQSEGTC
jgi:hypothetical protein